MQHMRLLVIGAAVAGVFGFAAAAASANNLAFSSSTGKINWVRMTFSSSPGGEGTTISCPVTWEGTFHSSTFTKELHLLVGHVTRVSTREASCTGGEAVFPSEPLPWHVGYESFSGTLPEIREITWSISGHSIVVDLIGIGCEYADTGSSSVEFGLVINGEGQATALAPDEDMPTPKAAGGLFCPGNIYMSGTGSVTDADGEAVYLELI